MPSRYFRLQNIQPIGITWMHVAATFDGQEIRLYVDGVLETTKAAGGPGDWHE